MDKIYEAEEIYGEGLQAAAARLWFKRRGGILPSIRNESGQIVTTDTLQAHISWGRMVVECDQGCGYALAASRPFPYFICISADCPDDSWKAVQFPSREIEDELLKRGKVSGDDRTNARRRNWRPGETLDDIRRENARAIAVGRL